MALKEEKEFAVSGKQKGSVRRETNAVSGMRVTIVQNRHRKPLHLLSQSHHEGEVCREKKPQGHKPDWEVQLTAVQILLER